MDLSGELFSPTVRHFGPPPGMYPVEARGKPADDQTKNELREGIQIVHAELEASGTLAAKANPGAAG
ncbi:MAG: hypothetical protein GX571_10975 [Lentisphaerae bacterium]|jgi:hypothetical protein|nr:hypothetical protein [Lentisphaerota bacterium]